MGGQAGRMNGWVDKWTAKDRYSGGWWVDGQLDGKAVAKKRSGK